MPAKKKAAGKMKKAPAKKAVPKKKAKQASTKKESPVKKAVPLKTIVPPPARIPEPLDTHLGEHHEETGPMVECEHCLGAGKCTAGEPYDKGHHQMFGAKLILTSCFDCLESAGEHRNSKKLVACRICDGRGMVKA
jgi:hypothetical protein